METDRETNKYRPFSRTQRQKAKALVLSSLTLIGFTYSAMIINAPIRTAAGTTQAFDYVTVILMENNGLCDIINTTLGGCSGTGSGTYMTSLVTANSIGTHYTGITHPSEPNYLALIGGSTFGITSDGNCCWQLSNPNIIDRIEASGRTWKAFAENAAGSGTCSFRPIPREADHFAFLEFSDLNTSSRCANFLATTSPNDQEFLSVLNGTNPPNFLWLTPNDTDNMHSSSVSRGDNYLSNLVPKILSSTTFTTKNAALFIVFDEGSDNCPAAPSGDCVYATWAGPVVKKAYSSNAQYNHYSFLKTLETVWSLSSLTSNDQSATAMTEFFQGNTPSSGPSGTTSNPFLDNWIWIALPVVALVAFSLAIVFIVRSRKESSHAGRQS